LSLFAARIGEIQLAVAKFIGENGVCRLEFGVFALEFFVTST
jgi:hypothetical protein